MDSVLKKHFHGDREVERDRESEGKSGGNRDAEKGRRGAEGRDGSFSEWDTQDGAFFSSSVLVNWLAQVERLSAVLIHAMAGDC